jgi:hypothetical protein
MLDPQSNLTMIGEFHRIAEQVQQDLPESRYVTEQHQRKAMIQQDAQLQVIRLRSRPRDRYRVVDQSFQRERLGSHLNLPNLDLRKSST